MWVTEDPSTMNLARLSTQSAGPSTSSQDPWIQRLCEIVHGSIDPETLCADVLRHRTMVVQYSAAHSTRHAHCCTGIAMATQALQMYIDAPSAGVVHTALAPSIVLWVMTHRLHISISPGTLGSIDPEIQRMCRSRRSRDPTDLGLLGYLRNRVLPGSGSVDPYPQRPQSV